MKVNINARGLRVDCYPLECGRSVFLCSVFIVAVVVCGGPVFGPCVLCSFVFILTRKN